VVGIRDDETHACTTEEEFLMKRWGAVLHCKDLLSHRRAFVAAIYPPWRLRRLMNLRIRPKARVVKKASWGNIDN
jgi:hypothetical protein